MNNTASGPRSGRSRRGRGHATTNRKGARHQQRRTDQSRKRGAHPAAAASAGATRGRSQQRRPKHKAKSKVIDPSRYVHKAIAQKAEKTYVPKHEFSDFRLHPTIQKNIVARHYKLPTPIQDELIQPILRGRDVIGLANTGTGKTAAFVLPLIHKLIGAKNQERVLILAPTRELAQQIDEEFRAFARGTGLRSVICVGGTSMQKQRTALTRKPQFIIGTPGRILDLIGQKLLRLGETRSLVLDEFDRMLDMGFIKDIERILSHLPQKRQSLCFSATMSGDIEHILEKHLDNPLVVSVVKSETAENVEQEVMVARSKEEKLRLLSSLLVQDHFKRVLVFGRTKWGVQKLAKNLTQSGIRAEAIHGNKTQPQRQRALDSFKRGIVDVLVATDVAARGLDIPDVSHVINFDEPADFGDYIHRIGRTGRAGKRGHAITFVERQPK